MMIERFLLTNARSAVPGGSPQFAPGRLRDRSSWVDYWDRLGADRLLAPAEAALVARRYLSLHRGSPLRVVFDFGCGPGRVAAMIADAGPSVIAWDAAPTMRESAGTHQRVTVVENWPDEIPTGSVDEVLINSVVQYLDAPTLQQLLGDLRPVLAPTGTIILADVIPPGDSLITDLVDLMTFAVRERFPLRALEGATVEAVRRVRSYRSLRLFRISFEDLAGLAAGVGFDTEPIEPNLSHFSRRYTVRLIPR